MMEHIPGFESIATNRGGIGENIINDVISIKNVYEQYAVILKNDGSVWAWGGNYGGVLGDSLIKESNTPQRIVNLDSIIAISVEGSRCLALRQNGTVWFWGLLFQDSDDNIHIQKIPIKIENIDNVKLIKASASKDFLFMKNDGSYWRYNVISGTVEKIILK
jgi:alpha-tubulin suppressor-like RCC1 family protein